jgi:glycosyltransferase involved in cell wall biosynthesis
VASPESPRVSIGLPVYNGENFVGHAIESVINQTYKDWELVISDNGSTDSTEKICAHYAERDPRIRYVRSASNKGAAWNFNEVFYQSVGEYFRWLSHDDYLMPTLLQKSVQVLDANPGYVSCATATGAIDEGGFRILDDAPEECDLACQGLTEQSEHSRLEYAEMDSRAKRFLGILMYSRRCNEVYGLIRREVMAQTQLHPNYCGGEKVLLAEIALRGKIFEIPELLFFVRWHTERFTSNASTREQDEHMATDTSRVFSLPHQYRATLGYLALIAAVPMKLTDRLGCFVAWTRFTLQVSKWASILRNTIAGRATWAEIEGKTKEGELIHGPMEVECTQVSDPKTTCKAE